MRKYRNKKTELDGITFDSQAEARHYALLKIRERAGEISELKTQVKFVLADSVRLYGRKRPAVTYVADFTYIEDGKLIVADVKGMRTPLYILKRHLLMATHGIEILEVT